MMFAVAIVLFVDFDIVRKMHLADFAINYFALLFLVWHVNFETISIKIFSLRRALGNPLKTT